MRARRIAVKLIILGAAAAVSTSVSCAARAPSDAELKIYAEAKAAYAQGELTEAERALSPLARSSSLPQARLLLGKARFFSGKYGEAESAFKDLGASFPKYHEADIWLARACLQNGKVDEADAIAKALLANDASDSRLYYLEAMIQVARGDAGGALGFLEKSCESGEELAKSYFESARIYYRFGQDDKALERLSRADAMLPPGSPMRDVVAELIGKCERGGTK
jgi:tetratricopeptide (TPR) repeat protein